MGELTRRYIERVIKNIPPCMKDKKRWIFFSGKVLDNKKVLKKPFGIKDGRAQYDSWQDYAIDFEQAVRLLPNLENALGFGYIIQDGDGIGGIDFDNCVQDSKVSEDIKTIVRKIPRDAYVETSFSGTGLHALVSCKPNRTMTQDSRGIEIYTKGRFFTITGKSLKQFSPNGHLPDATELIDTLIGEAAVSAKPIYENYIGVPIEMIPEYSIPKGQGNAFMLKTAAQIKNNSPVPSEQGIFDQLMFHTKFLEEAKLHPSNPDMEQRHIKNMKAMAKTYYGYYLQDNVEQQGPDWENLLTTARLSARRAKDKETSKAFIIPEQVFLSAPGILGELTNAIYNGSRHPMASASFCAALTIMATIKGGFYTTKRNDWCAIYSAVLAPSGSGKEDPQRFVEETLKALNLRKLFGGKIASARSVVGKMKSNNGQATFVFDEIASFMSSIQDKGANSQAHMSEVCSLLLSLFSKTGRLYVDPATSTRKETTVENVCVSVMGSAVLASFNKMFTIDSVISGLLGRMLIFAHPKKSPKNKSYVADYTLSSSLMAKLRELSAPAADYRSPEERIAQIEQEISSMATLPTDATQEESQVNAKIKGDYTRQIEEVKQEIAAGLDDGLTNKIRVAYTDDALEYMEEFEESLVPLHDKLVEEGIGKEAIISRTCELAGRMSLIGSYDVIDLELVKFSTNLVKLLSETMLVLCESTMDHPMEQAMDKVYRKLVELFSESGEPIRRSVLSQSQLQRGTGYTFNEIAREMKISGTYFAEEQKEVSSGQKMPFWVPIVS